MKTTTDLKTATETTDSDEAFFESVLRERSPLTGEIPPPRYSLLPQPICAEAAQPGGNKAFHFRIRNSWKWLAVAGLLAMLIVFLLRSNTNAAEGHSQPDATSIAPSKK